MIAAASWLCLLAPLAGALLITLAGTRISRAPPHGSRPARSSSASPARSSRSSRSSARSPDDRGTSRRPTPGSAAGSFDVAMQILVDPLSLTMMLIITGVGGLIVLYSMGYMAGEDEERRYFAYMALFVFSMLMLVMGGNLLLLLAGWGLVGLASYLLIGFYHDRPEAVAAAKKAFIMNAIGDAAMALGFFLLIAKTGSLDFSTTFEAASAASSHRARRTSSRSDCSAARSRSRPSSRSRPGCPTRWKARRRSPPSSTPRRWSPPAST